MHGYLLAPIFTRLYPILPDLSRKALSWVVLTRALTRNAIINTVSVNESLVSALVSEASVSDVLLTNERCH